MIDKQGIAIQEVITQNQWASSAMLFPFPYNHVVIVVAGVMQRFFISNNLHRLRLDTQSLVIPVPYVEQLIPIDLDQSPGAIFSRFQTRILFISFNIATRHSLPDKKTPPVSIVLTRRRYRFRLFLPISTPSLAAP